MERLELPESVRTTGPVLEDDGTHRWLLFFPLADGDAATVAVLTQDAVTVVARPGRDGPGGVLLAVRRRDDPVLPPRARAPESVRPAAGFPELASGTPVLSELYAAFDGTTDYQPFPDARASRVYLAKLEEQGFVRQPHTSAASA